VVGGARKGKTHPTRVWSEGGATGGGWVVGDAGKR
jgi:hypothetical protein